MRFDERNRSRLCLVAGILGMAAQERLSLMSGNMIKSASLLILAVSVGLLLFAQAAAFRAGYEQASHERRGIGRVLSKR